MRYRVKATGDLATHLRRLFQSLSEDIALSLLQACRDSETGIHEARKGCKEVRALLRLLRPQLGGDTFRRHQQFYRSVAGQLAGNRDAMVMLNTWRNLQDLWPELRSEGFRSVDTRLTAEEKIDPISHQGESFFINLARELERERFAAADRAFPSKRKGLIPSLERIYRKARKSERIADKSDQIDDFHEFRKRSKDLFYCLRMLRPLLSKQAKPTVRALRDMTETQGLVNDHAVLLEFLTAQQQAINLSPDDWSSLQQILHRRINTLQNQAHRKARKLLKASPSDFIKSLSHP
ncbi:MAG: CHAD domain-containing protein [Oleiphilaceae bacterium]|nr:CHAD domain-containing protein [Oleiphilaceae bacterium]